MMMKRVPTKPNAWIPKNQSRSQKNRITTGSTILSPKYIWLKPIPRRHLFNIPNRVPIRSQSSSSGSLVVGSSTWGQWAVGSLGGRDQLPLPSSCGDRTQVRLQNETVANLRVTKNLHIVECITTKYDIYFT